MHTKHQSVFVTGCSSGIGYAIAQHLAKHPTLHVIASCRKPHDVHRLQQEGIECISLDLDDSDSIAAAVSYLKQHAIPLYALVNNAAYGQPGAVEDLRRDVITAQFETNVFGTMELTNSLLPLLRQRDDARVIQISSILGFVCARYRGAYNASKYALEALTDTMRLELSHSTIAFSLIEPGPIESAFRANAYEKFKQHVQNGNSVYEDQYNAVVSRLGRAENSKGTLPASVVADTVIHALTVRRPKIRYRICRVTKLAAIAKRIMPARLMDWFILRGDGN